MATGNYVGEVVKTGTLVQKQIVIDKKEGNF